MKAHAVAYVVAICSLSSFAFGQGASTPSSPTPAASPPSSSGQAAASGDAASGGMRMGDTAPPIVVRFITMRPADTMSSRLIGTNVLNNQNETIGEIEDLVIQDGKTVTGVVVSTGGFLGMGERYVLIEPSSIVLSQKDGSMRAFVNTTKENLKSAPPFTYTKKKS